jgi:hypothetical protein
VGYDLTNIYQVWNLVTNKVVRTRDVTFNKYETFNGDLETLKDDMLKIQLDELLKLLQECTIPEELEEETLVQLAQEEPDEIRSLAEDEILVHLDSLDGVHLDSLDGAHPTQIELDGAHLMELDRAHLMELDRTS